MKPCPTISTRPRGRRSAPRRTQASGSTIVARASSTSSGRSTQPCVCTRSANPPGRIVAAANASHVDSCPARQRAHSPHGRWWRSATRRPSTSATTSWPSTSPACSGVELLDVRAAEAAGEDAAAAPLRLGHVDELRPPLLVEYDRAHAEYRRAMAIKLYRCSQLWVKIAGPSVLAGAEGARRPGDRIRARERPAAAEQARRARGGVGPASNT